ncbi:MAG: GTPase RsgA, partial [Propionicimonas sp.]
MAPLADKPIDASLLGDLRLATGPVGQAAKGRHTTTARELVRLSGGALLIDTPGLRELGLWADEDSL